MTRIQAFGQFITAIGTLIAATALLYASRTRAQLDDWRWARITHATQRKEFNRQQRRADRYAHMAQDKRRHWRRKV